MGVKTRILYGFLLARSRPVVSLNTASNKVRADVAKKSFRVKLRVKVGTMTECTVFSQKRRWIDLSAGQVYPGEVTRFSEVWNQGNVPHPD